ncbi:MAG: phosphatidylglycerol lysyltransferase domain-containing protein, partial [Polyangiaceae bacterium]
LETGMLHWRDAGPGGTGACVAYVEAAGAWIAACAPLVAAADPGAAAAEAGAAAGRFVEAARAAGRRACFFATETLEVPAMARTLVGEQPVFRPGAWVKELSRHRRLREQLRRARAKGLRARRVEAGELAAGTPLRVEVDHLGASWLRARHLEPMGFLAAVEPFQHPEAHRYFVAEQRGRVVGFLSAVPMGRGRAWLAEDVFRDRAAPSGTTETLIHALMLDVADADAVTLGLTALSGPVAWPLRAARWLSRPLYDFAGLRAFRERMHPHAWQPVYMVGPRWPGLHLLDALRAFSRGSLAAFAARSFVRHPSGLPWALALPLPAWTLVLAWLALVHRASLLGFPPGELALWVAFDALLLFVLVRVAMRPRRSRLVVATSFAAFDAALSIGHLAWVGPGSTLLQASLRGVATLAPTAGALLLAWATTQTTA